VVRVVGEFDAARQILIDNKVHSGRAGYHVVTPLHLGNDRVVLVDRGWVAPGATRAELPAVPPPAGVVAVTGRINVPPVGYLELAPAAAGPLWQNLDPGRFAAATGLGVLPAVIEETDAPAAANGLIRDWPAPDFGADRHRIYRAQWYAFAALVAGLLGYFELRSLRRKPSPEL
jgi:surfeit locus 1 family protein